MLPCARAHGNICLDILQDKWSSAYDVRAVLLSIQSLLGGNGIATDLLDSFLCSVDPSISCAPRLRAFPSILTDGLCRAKQRIAAQHAGRGALGEPGRYAIRHLASFSSTIARSIDFLF